MKRGMCAWVGIVGEGLEQSPKSRPQPCLQCQPQLPSTLSPAMVDTISSFSVTWRASSSAKLASLIGGLRRPGRGKFARADNTPDEDARKETIRSRSAALQSSDGLRASFVLPSSFLGIKNHVEGLCDLIVPVTIPDLTKQLGLPPESRRITLPW